MASDVTPHDAGRAGRGRAATTVGSLLVGAVTAGALCLPLALRVRSLLAGHRGPWRVDAAVEVGVTSVGLLVAAWLACSALMAVACLLVRVAGTTWRTGERLVHRYAPQVVRKALVLAVGAGIGLGMASGSTAAAPEPVPTSSVTAEVTAPGDLGWVVTTPAPEQAEPVPAPAPAVETPVLTGATELDVSIASPDTAVRTSVGEPPPAPAPKEVVVVAGDSLWAIAARYLPPGASDAEVAAAWPAWYQANAAVIGSDPDLIQQGQVLTAPVAAGEVAR
ncbi:LysM peptidoglycan-binding domain-containing protein [Cellulomonas humilata]|uniref:LysM peptidoglycan-binding domain-containing protein n=1 Tax=Cellulomonas humilata TaxID=144055 RepID=A0A7Y5ZX93_9CELL|nr:LysM domain-containing protein [Cellulomonas humilata]NUU15680.1 LysM peptidoglycan-binding domain-containing protein [Cellulomonas humilata]